ncbi:MAG: phosphatase [Atopobiaceae bacterium]|nr:phosphatase [Atopobiaceae bacterium]
MRVAVIDVGTVTARLAIADVENGRVVRMAKQSNIVNLGEGVDQTGELRPEACLRLLECIDQYLAAIAQANVAAVCCTLTSAARDARNSGDLLGALEARGLTAQVIPGEVEGRLTFLGVAQDFVATRLLVADNGGGSTEFAMGRLTEDGVLDLDFVQSIDVGCRRMTEKFLQVDDPPTQQSIDQAHAFAAQAFAPLAATWMQAAEPPRRLVVTGGTSTTLVALVKALVPYDPAQVHLATLTLDQVTEQERRLAALTALQRAELPGIQPKRAPVILGGAIAVSEVLRAWGLDELTVSESDLLFGLSLTLAAAAQGQPTPVGWAPDVKRS